MEDTMKQKSEKKLNLRKATIQIFDDNLGREEQDSVKGGGAPNVSYTNIIVFCTIG
jgi:hypothetical protein